MRSKHVTFRVAAGLLERLDKLRDHIARVHYPAKPTVTQSDLIRAALARGVLTLELEVAEVRSNRQGEWEREEGGWRLVDQAEGRDG